VAELFDVVVVGAGPTGSVLAYTAARRGLRVALIDRQVFPRDKPCGDGIGPGAVRVAREIGLGGIFATDRPVTTIRVIGPDGVELTGSTSQIGDGTVEGYVVPRLDFDNRLHERALEAGARDLSGVKFTGTSITGQGRVVELQAAGNREQITARLLVGADGANSVVRRVLGAAPSPPRSTGIAMRAYATSGSLDEAGPQMLFSFSRELLPSYAWLFPTGQGTVNIGVGGPVKEIRRPDQDLKQTLSMFADQVRAQGTDLGELYALRAHRLPHLGGMPALAYPRAALIGDAASMINPFSGEGISYGMTAAARLVAALPDDLSDASVVDSALTGFERSFRRDYRAHIASVRVLHKMMRSPYWAKVFISAAAQDPLILHDAIDLLFGFGRASGITAARILRTRWAGDHS
jgi:geranylgeranyl reductase family protein